MLNQRDRYNSTVGLQYCVLYTVCIIEYFAEYLFIILWRLHDGFEIFMILYSTLKMLNMDKPVSPRLEDP